MHYEIFYIDAKTGWAVALFDEHRNQIGNADFCYRKSEAKDWAKRICDGKEIWVFTKANNWSEKTILKKRN